MNGTAWRGYGVAVASVFGAAALRAALHPLLGSGAAFVTFPAAVALSAWYGGLGPALVATGLGGIAAWALFLSPLSSPVNPPPSGVTAALGGVLLYVLASGVIAGLGASERRARRRAELAAESGTSRRGYPEAVVPAGEAVPGSRPLEEAFRTPADQVVNYAIFMVDRAGRNASWNTGVERLLGYRRADFVGAPAADLFTSEDRAAGIPDRLLREAAERDRVSDERWVIRQDGTRLWAAMTVSTAVSKRAQLLGYAITLRDLSAMRRMQEALRRREETLEVALEAASLGTWDHDLTSGALHWDARAKSLFGLPPDVAVTADTWARVIHPDDLAALEASRERALHQRAPFSAEYRVSWPDGSLHSIAMIGRATFDPASDRPLRMAGIMLDTTERKRQEERLQEAVRLEAIGRLAGGIAHDLNNMLAAILGFSEFLAQGMPPGDARRHDVDQITQAASRSAALTRQLLAFARRELIQPHRLDVNAVVTRIEPMLHALLGESAELVLVLAPEPVVIYADAAQVEQSLTNLVLNARDAMPQGGRVTIETGVVALGPGAPGPWPELEKPGSGRYVMLAVKDTGHGMDPVTLQRIWEPFFTTKPAGRGTGLGLSAVYGAVRQCGGFVWAESEPGRGTVVSLYWPELAGAPEPAPEAGPPNAERGSESVLVVEDEPLVRRLVVRGLETLGYHCAEAVNAADAMDLVERGAVHPDLVITDVVLPEQSGRTLGERLAALQPGLPVLFISGYASEDMIRRGLLEPGRPFLQKPFTPAELAREVRMVLDSAAERRRAGAPGM